MKKITLCGINARYSHSNLAIMCLKHAAGPRRKINIIEMSINDRVSQIVDSIVCSSPDAVGFSCYIWNIDHVLKAASSIKKILPDCLIILGGPEVSSGSAAIMQEHPFIDMVIRGQGEIPFSCFLESFESNLPIDNTPSACVRAGDTITVNDEPAIFDMDSMPFMYGGLRAYRNKIIYYETSRGCPFSCSYCMSAKAEMSYLCLDRVKKELEYFMKSNVRQVKLVDRTFNYPQDRSREILQTLIHLSKKYPDSNTTFHFEISACLLEDETISLIKQAKKGLFRFEIGIQSTHPQTLKAINRNHDTQKLFLNTKILCDMANIHVHVDLIAGLPCESYKIFAKSFDDAYHLGAEKLQLGFLKVLKGTSIRESAEEYDIKYTQYAPYEVLSTHAISYKELRRLHEIEHAVDSLYNSGHFKKTLEHLIPAFISPFDFYEQLAEFLSKNDYFSRPQKKQALFDMLYLFAKETHSTDRNIIKEALVFDWLCIEKPRSWPKHIELSQTDIRKMQIRSFFKDEGSISKYLPLYQNLSSGEISKRCFICTFRHILKGSVLFDYGQAANDEKLYQNIDFL